MHKYMYFQVVKIAFIIIVIIISHLNKSVVEKYI